MAIKSAVAKTPHIIKWEKMKYIIFDTPQPGLRSTATYKDRYNLLTTQVPENHLFSLVKYEVCTGKDFVENVSLIRSREGEGIILRDPYAFYMNGYSRFLYKHKGFNDAEALVLKKLSDERYLCRVHKLHIKHNLDPSANKEAAETQEAANLFDDTNKSKFYDIEMVLDNQLYEGDLKDLKEGGFVSFRYAGTTFGPPDWEQLVRSKRVPPGVQFAHQKIWKPVMNTKYDWTSLANRRAYFDKFAHDRGFDPLIPDNWYGLERKDFQGGILNCYGSHFRAIMELYPDIGLEKERFIRLPNKYWRNEDNRKKFFDSMASSLGFDPLIAENWYQFSISDISRMKRGASVLHHYSGSIYHALTDVYPFTKFDKHEFNPGRYKEKANREEFLMSFALARGFDPLVAENWYGIICADFDSMGGASVLAYYNGSIYRTVSDIFPDIGLEKHLFTRLPNGHWGDKNNQKKFFDDFAQSHGNFDPLVSSNWSSFSDSDITSSKMGANVLRNYKGKLGTALAAVYAFDPPPQVFEKVPKRGKWATREARKRFFDELAEKRNFDPNVPENWYSIPFYIIKEGGPRYYYKALSDAVIDLYPNIGLEKSKFNLLTPRSYWLSMDNRRKHFDDYAKSMGFNPLIPENWYHLTSLEASQRKGGLGLLRYYHSSVIKALVDIYPGIGLDTTKFRGRIRSK